MQKYEINRIFGMKYPRQKHLLQNSFMTKSRNLRITLAAAAAAIISTVLLISWDHKPAGSPFLTDYFRQAADTVPKKDNREKKIRDLDDVLEELDKAELKLNIEKIQKELADALKKIDTDKIRLEVEKTLKEVNTEKIKKELEESIAKIDWDKMKAELEKVKEIDFKKLEMDMKKMEKELSKIGPEIERSLEKAKAEIEKARAEMKEFNEFVEGLEKDGLLKRNDGYTIKHKDGELFVNDKKVAAEVYNKYRSFLEKHKKFNIKKADDDFNTDID
jgi:hypothetical protein